MGKSSKQATQAAAIDFESLQTSALAVASKASGLPAQAYINRYYETGWGTRAIFTNADHLRWLYTSDSANPFVSLKASPFMEGTRANLIRNTAITEGNYPNLFNLLYGAWLIDYFYTQLQSLGMPEEWEDLLVSRPTELKLVKETAELIKAAEPKRTAVEAARKANAETRNPEDYRAALAAWEEDERSIREGIDTCKAVCNALASALEAVRETAITAATKKALTAKGVGKESTQDLATGVRALAHVVRENAQGTESNAKATIAKQKEQRQLGV